MRFPIGYSRLRLLAVVGAVAVWLLLTSIALAAPTGQEGSDPEANLPFLFGVYTVTWLAFFAYVFYIMRRQHDLRREIRDLRRTLEERKGQ